jgi:hypothetical protein
MSIEGLKLEDDLIVLENGRRPTYFDKMEKGKWKTS